MIVYPYSFISTPSTIDYITLSSDTVDRTTYTFTDVNIGGPGLIVVLVHTQLSGPSISSATIGGLSATIAVQISSTDVGNAIIYRRITTGTTATISITFTVTQGACGIGVYRIQNNKSDTPFQTQSDRNNFVQPNASFTFTSLPTNTIGVVGNSLFGNRTTTWTNATEQYDQNLTAQLSFSGANFKTTASGNRTITETFSSTVRYATVGAVWV